MVCSLLFLGLFTIPETQAAQSPSSSFGQPQAEEQKAVLTYSQLRSLLANYADEYMQMVGQAADTLQKQDPNPDSRAGIHSIKLYPCSAAFSIAVEPNPHIALLDMVALVHLQGKAWEKGPIKKRFGNKASALFNSQKDLENDIDAIALKVMNPGQLQNIKTLVNEWIEKHPDQRYVSYIRFSDFAELKYPREKGNMPNFLSISGLLSAFQLVNVDETSRSVDQARMVAERALYLSQRMPLLLRWHAEMLIYETSGETKTLSHLIIWDTAKALLVVACGIFLLAILYKSISKKI